LTPYEERQLAHHPELGASLLDGMDIRPVDVWIRHHHEHWDGSGYPFGLEGEEIPFGSRVILVADAYDAMTTDRSYREAASPGDALVELRRQAGVQFDPSVVAALAAHLEDVGLVSPLEVGEVVLLDRQVA
jgi:putative two-component system response regulator